MQTFSQSNKKCFIVRKACSPLGSFLWNRRLSRYVKAGQHEKAFELFKEMQQKGTTFDSSTFVPMLNACTSLGAREEVR
jgi:pentatricopeptide repeat protein